MPNVSKPSGWKEGKSFYSEAMVEFGFIKDAWRNHVMHGSRKYGKDDAQKILEHTKHLTRHMAKV